MNKEKMLRHLRDDEEKKVMTRILDLVEQVLVKHQVMVSDFLDPYHAGLARDILQGIADIDFIFQGGHRNAERKRIVIFPPYLRAELIEPKVQALKVSGTGQQFKVLSHRDFLGAVLGLGLRREKIGDILVAQDSAFMMVAAELAQFVEVNLKQVGRVPVTVKILAEGELDHEYQGNFKLIRATVASLRLDAVGGHGFNLSRTQMAQEIRAGKVKLNWKITTDPAKTVQEGDTISVSGRGRMVVEEITGTTKKGRIGLVIKRLL